MGTVRDRGGSNPVHRNQANARERDRTHRLVIPTSSARCTRPFERPIMLTVNQAFCSLRALIPTEPKNRKLSKIETLRLATSYIAHLDTQLHSTDSVICSAALGARSGFKICTFCLAARSKTNK
ncbi:scleraxis-like [Frankliniella occidentalis]|nr:scleraxis-like [Frankliniella occidentalis]